MDVQEKAPKISAESASEQGMQKAGTWVRGQSGNPAGRPIGARQKISEKLLADLATTWEKHGANVLERLAVTEPAKLATIAYGLLPRDVFVQVQAQPSAIDPEQWTLLAGIARTMKEIAPDASLEDVEAALRASFATVTVDN
jgi:hypothetical protein